MRREGKSANTVQFKLPFTFRAIQASIIGFGGAYLFSLLFPEEAENVLFDVADYLVVPAMHFMDPENAHKFAIYFAKNIPLLFPKDLQPKSAVLETSLWSLPFSNPIGLAAGFDKDAEVVGPLLDLGFGFIEVGTVTPAPQPGNNRPRLFRLEKDQAIINRYGFNSKGMRSVQENLRRFENCRSTHNPGILGVNVGKNKDTDESMVSEDYSKVIESLGPSADYVVVNISSPNTPGLRTLASDTENLKKILVRSLEARDKAIEYRIRLRRNMLMLPSNAIQKKQDGMMSKYERPLSLPLLVKISPDLSDNDLDNLLKVILSIRRSDDTPAIDGIVVCNTTTSRPDTLISGDAREAGGLSGAPLKNISTHQVANIYLRTHGQIPIIGVGGISTGSDAFEKIAAGATLVQVYSMLIYRGPGSIRAIKRDLSKILREKGFKNVQEAVGSQATQFATGKFNK